jgi:hypothetical protein
MAILMLYSRSERDAALARNRAPESWIAALVP